MAVLKKIKSATLVETLVASALIVLVFTIASLTINNTFKGVLKADDFLFKNRLQELQYFAKNKQLEIPFFESTDQWEVEIENHPEGLLLVGNYKPLDSVIKITINDAP